MRSVALVATGTDVQVHWKAGGEHETRMDLSDVVGRAVLVEMNLGGKGVTVYSFSF